ncbi:hypothetical protein C2845_PM04G11570 [Panicum miliaceum]|uniref:Uncharacterized protein n=1 Tax=Panicum miliaceum TaxID=4540 RepID=A0A3L6QTP9_PANMI|nr:hypothetical protein C2845_PM04G11570 [Panicum miliaceum]
MQRPRQELAEDRTPPSAVRSSHLSPYGQIKCHHELPFSEPYLLHPSSMSSRRSTTTVLGQQHPPPYANKIRPTPSTSDAAIGLTSAATGHGSRSPEFLHRSPRRNVMDIWASGYQT